MIITALMGLGLSRKMAGIAVWAVGILAVLGLFYWALDSYGDRRYEKGKHDTEEAYQKASDKLMQEAGEARTQADKQAAVAAVEYATKVEDEKEKIDAAIADGSSPLDVLFGNQ